MASLSQGRTAAAQCGLFTHKSVLVIFEPPCIKSVLWRVAKFLSYIEEARCLKVNVQFCISYIEIWLNTYHPPPQSSVIKLNLHQQKQTFTYLNKRLVNYIKFVIAVKRDCKIFNWIWDRHILQRNMNFECWTQSQNLKQKAHCDIWGSHAVVAENPSPWGRDAALLG